MAAVAALENASTGLAPRGRGQGAHLSTDLFCHHPPGHRAGRSTGLGLIAVHSIAPRTASIARMGASEHRPPAFHVERIPAPGCCPPRSPTVARSSCSRSRSWTAPASLHKPNGFTAVPISDWSRHCRQPGTTGRTTPVPRGTTDADPSSTRTSNRHRSHQPTSPQDLHR